jgi:hypothetical protein
MDRIYGFGLAELLAIRFAPGRPRTARPHQRGVIEHLFLTSGKLEAGPVGEVVILDAGDYLRFRGDVEHVYAAIGGKASAIVVITYPAGG